MRWLSLVAWLDLMTALMITLITALMITLITSLMAGFTIMAGCSDTSQVESAPDPWQNYMSDLERDLTPVVAAGELATLVQGNQEFAIALNRELGGQAGNMLFSPLSIRIAFALVYAGARGETDQQMTETLRYLLTQERLHPTYNALDLELATRNLPRDPEGADPVEWHLANAFWGKVGYPFLASYLDLLAVNYGSGIKALDYAGDPDGSRQIINSWVEDQTRNRIVDLLPPGSITPATAAVLTNAVYFKAPWEHPFDEALTQDDTFHLLDGGTVTVPMMLRDAELDYTAGGDYQAVEIPFRKAASEPAGLAMVFLLPSAGQFLDFESRLDADLLTGILAQLTPAGVHLVLPKFQYEFACRLKTVLFALGMELPFSAGADFTGILARGGLFIDEAYHKAFIAVDEKGAEAAAATAVVMNETGIPAGPEFKADRPFLFLIRDQVTGAILFLGKVVNPDQT